VPLALLILMELNAAPAHAHPSDFETLTVDLLVGPGGLQAVDAAVVESTGAPYETPEPNVRQDVALLVLDQLGVVPDAVDIELDSERYHWVGFTIRLHQPWLGLSVPLAIDTSALQRRTAELGLAYLKVSVCGVSDGAARSDPAVLTQLVIEATHEGRRPRGLDREACTVWRLTPSDEPVRVQVRLTDLAETGTGIGAAVAATAAALLLGALSLIGARIRTSSEFFRLIRRRSPRGGR
jgi:hypothetical protein